MVRAAGTIGGTAADRPGPGGDANGYASDRPTHDAAGNLTYDGRYACTFDAWNRLAAVARAYPTSTGHATASAVATMQYDGLHRRIVKQVAHTGLDTDATFHYYYDTSWRLLETRYEYNGPTRKLAKHHVWGARYIDELIQIGINTDANDDCDAFYYAATNANFNVIGLIDGADGSLVERYEYTPYGRRTVYAKSGADDWLTSAPMWHSQLVPGKPYTLNDIGHQGLTHDRESGLVNNRMRYLSPRLGRWMTWDPIGYGDGMNLYQDRRGRPITLVDPQGDTANTCEYVRNVAPTSAGTFTWLDTRWTYVAMVPDKNQIQSTHPAVSLARPKKLYVRAYTELYKCCDRANCPIYAWGRKGLAGGWEENGFSLYSPVVYIKIPFVIPIPGGGADTPWSIDLLVIWQKGSNPVLALSAGQPNTPIFWSDYKKLVPSGYTYVERINCDSPPWTKGPIPPPPKSRRPPRVNACRPGV